MTTFQKIVKYLAIALAIFLCISIFSSIIGVIGIFAGLETLDNVDENIKSYPIEGEITSLRLRINAADLTIAEGDAFAVESNLKKLTVKESNSTLIIEEENSFGIHSTGASLVISIPKDFVFAEARLETGAGRVQADRLCAERLDLELGAGEVFIGELIATGEANVDGGAGKIKLEGGSLHNLELDMGVGKCQLACALTGDCELNLGVGDTDVTLLGEQDSYRLSFEKGIGSVTLDGNKVHDGEVFGDGTNRVGIECGVGSVRVAFAAQ